METCSYCSEIHEIKLCPVFKALRLATSKNTYTCYNGHVKKEDFLGCCAAGVMPQIVKDGRCYYLLAYECRNEIIAYNFLGGKRNKKSETPLKIALREFYEELSHTDGSCLINNKTKSIIGKMNKYNKVLWYGPSKYALYPMILPTDCWDIVSRFDSTKSKELRGLKWMQLNTPDEINMLHPFSRAMFNALRN